MVRREDIVEVQGLAGGKGPAYVHHIVSKEELLGHGRLYARVVLPPRSSVGWHQHVHDTEPYYILKGEGDFTEGDGNGENRTVTRVRPGDVCVIHVGQWHCLENNSGADLEFMALIYNETGYSNL
ncbi:MAG: cupin domain-containing protein [Fretibacterium sp.]|nr:cupin domain-containing protein [Fretibacterium sp.]